MRENKFRAWDKENNKMIGPFEVGSELSMLWKPEMQYTGLKDKSKKEVYEGDIIKTEERQTWGDDKIGIYKVKWNNERFRFAVVNKEGHEWSLRKIQDTSNWIERIGNMHSNPELLKG